jgi:hypothetical protein
MLVGFSSRMPPGRSTMTKIKATPIKAPRSSRTKVGLMTAGRYRVASDMPTGTRAAPSKAPQVFPRPPRMTAANRMKVSGGR